MKFSANPDAGFELVDSELFAGVLSLERGYCVTCFDGSLLAHQHKEIIYHHSSKRIAGAPRGSVSDAVTACFDGVTPPCNGRFGIFRLFRIVAHSQVSVLQPPYIHCFSEKFVINQ